MERLHHLWVSRDHHEPDAVPFCVEGYVDALLIGRAGVEHDEVYAAGASQYPQCLDIPRHTDPVSEITEERGDHCANLALLVVDNDVLRGHPPRSPLSW